MNAQFKKGVLELCVLTSLARRDAYGYELAEKISPRIQIAEGTLYPLLRRLKNLGLCETYLSGESGGPPRKYYKLTEKGRKNAQILRQDWESFAQNVSLLMEDSDKE